MPNTIEILRYMFPRNKLFQQFFANQYLKYKLTNRRIRIIISLNDRSDRGMRIAIYSTIKTFVYFNISKKHKIKKAYTHQIIYCFIFFQKNQ